MSQTSAYEIRIRTGSADSKGLLLLDNGELVAILVEMIDEGHGDARGQWTIECTFGLTAARRPETFPCAEAAAGWVGEHGCQGQFDLGGDLVLLR